MWHLLAHGLLRLGQFLRSPSWLEDAAIRRSTFGGGTFRSGFHVEQLLPMPLRRFLYAAALSRFGLDAMIDRLFRRPLSTFAHLVSSPRPRIRANNGGLIAERDLYRGTINRAAVEPRAILKEGLIHGACGLVVFHTHPSGDPSPSAEDLAFTRRLAEAGELVGIRLVDHLILGGVGRWTSLRERGAW
jgi:hypothetical protein